MRPEPERYCIRCAQRVYNDLTRGWISECADFHTRYGMHQRAYTTLCHKGSGDRLRHRVIDLNDAEAVKAWLQER